QTQFALTRCPSPVPCLLSPVAFPSETRRLLPEPPRLPSPAPPPRPLALRPWHRFCYRDLAMRNDRLLILVAGMSLAPFAVGCGRGASGLDPGASDGGDGGGNEDDGGGSDGGRAGQPEPPHPIPGGGTGGGPVHGKVTVFVL